MSKEIPCAGSRSQYVFCFGDEFCPVFRSGVFGINVLPLLTGAGVAGLAVAFASKETLSNFFGTLVIVADRPFRCGDMVRVGEVTGIVENIGMRSTRVRTGEETVVLIPNSRIESADIENISMRGVMRFAFSVGLVYSSTAADLERAEKTLHSIVDDFNGRDQERYKPRIFVDALGDSSIDIKCIMWLKTSDFKQEEIMRGDINRRIIDRFAAEKLEMAYNTVSNYLGNESDRPLRVRLERI